MFSGTRPPGQRNVFQHNSAPGFWPHNGMGVREGTAGTGPCRQTGAGLPRLDRGKAVSLTKKEAAWYDLGAEHAEINPDGQNPQGRPPFSAQRHHAQPASGNCIGLKESNPARWNHLTEPRLRHSTAVGGYFRKCDCAMQVQTQPHPFRKKYVLLPPARMVGQEHCRELQHVAEKQLLGSANVNYPREQHASVQERTETHNLSSCHDNFLHCQGYSNSLHGLKDLTRLRDKPEKVCNGPRYSQRDILPTGVSRTKLDITQQQSLCRSSDKPMDSRHNPPSEEQAKKREPPFDRSKGSPSSVRKQILQVVSDLERVLGGLKQVHLEMKEVVQQIEVLTSNVKLNDDEPSNDFPSNSSSSSGVMVSGRKMAGNLKSNSLQNTPVYLVPPVPNSSVIIADQAKLQEPCKGYPAGVHPTEDLPPVSPHREKEETVQTGNEELRSALSRTASPSPIQTVIHSLGQTVSRNRRPPPYPHNGQVKMISPANDSPRTPPYPVKRRLLSTTV